MNANLLKTIGLVVTVIGMGANLVSGIIADKQLDCKVEERVAMALTEKKGA